MTHSTNILPRSVDYDQTLILAIELSNKSWVLAAQVPGLSQIKAKRTIEPDKSAVAKQQPNQDRASDKQSRCAEVAAHPKPVGLPVVDEAHRDSSLPRGATDLPRGRRHELGPESP